MKANAGFSLSAYAAPRACPDECLRVTKERFLAENFILYDLVFSIYTHVR